VLEIGRRDHACGRLPGAAADAHAQFAVEGHDGVHGVMGVPVAGGARSAGGEQRRPQGRRRVDRQGRLGGQAHVRSLLWYNGGSQEGGMATKRAAKKGAAPKKKSAAAKKPAGKKPAAKKVTARAAAPQKKAAAKKKAVKPGVVHWEVQAKDPETQQRFFGDLFEWEVDTNNPMSYGMVSAQGKDTIGGGIGSGDGQPRVTFYVQVSDINETLAKAESLGAKTVMPRTDIGMIVMAQFLDLEGNVIGLVEG
jgi:predicted enzyme related to lactoylglutathione lyase